MDHIHHAWVRVELNLAARYQLHTDFLEHEHRSDRVITTAWDQFVKRKKVHSTFARLPCVLFEFFANIDDSPVLGYTLCHLIPSCRAPVDHLFL